MRERANGRRYRNTHRGLQHSSTLKLLEQIPSCAVSPKRAMAEERWKRVAAGRLASGLLWLLDDGGPSLLLAGAAWPASFLLKGWLVARYFVGETFRLILMCTKRSESVVLPQLACFIPIQPSELPHP